MAGVEKALTSHISVTRGDHEQECFPREGRMCAKTHEHVLSEFTEENLPEQNDDLCQEHQWKLNLFCKEPGCETPICVQCLYDSHKNHDFGNLEEVVPKRCEALLRDVQSMKEKLQSNKDKLITVQNKENTNFSTCIDNIRKNDIRKIKRKTELIVQTVLDQKAQIDNSFNEVVA